MANEGKVGQAAAEGAEAIAARLAAWVARTGAPVAEEEVDSMAAQVAKRLREAGKSADEIVNASDDVLGARVQSALTDNKALVPKTALDTEQAAPAATAAAKPLGALPPSPPPAEALTVPAGGGAGRGASGSWGKPAAAAALGAAVLGGGALLRGGDKEAAAQAPKPEPTPEAAPPAEGSLPKGLGRDGKVAPGFISDIGKLDLSKVGKAPTTGEFGLDKAPNYVNGRRADTELKAAVDEHRAVMNSLAAEYKAARTDTDRRELWEGIVHAVGLIASGIYGLRNNIDMSGIKFTPSDWEAKRRLELAQFSEFGQNADKQLGARKEYAAGLRSTDKEANDRLDSEWQRNSKLYDAAAGAYNERVDQTAKVWDSKYKDANLHNDVAYKQAELELQGAKLHDAASRATDKAAKTRLDEQAKKAAASAKMLSTFNAGMARAAGAKEEERKAWAPALQQQAEDFKRTTGAYPPGITPNMFVTQGGFFSGPGAADVRDVAKARGESLAKGAAPTAGGYPKTLTNGSHQAIVKNAAEEADANNAGYK